MNEVDIFKMEAGKQLDALVAEKVMGWIIRKVTDGYNITMDAWHSKDEDGWMKYPVTQNYFWSGSTYEPFTPSLDIGDAWEVAEKMMEYGIFQISNGDGDSCDVRFTSYGYLITTWKSAFITANSFPLAICRVALLAAP